MVDAFGAISVLVLLQFSLGFLDEVSNLTGFVVGHQVFEDHVPGGDVPGLLGFYPVARFDVISVVAIRPDVERPMVGLAFFDVFVSTPADIHFPMFIDSRPERAVFGDVVRCFLVDPMRFWFEKVFADVIAGIAKRFAVTTLFEFRGAGDFEVVLMDHFMQEDVVHEAFDAKAVIPVFANRAMRPVEDVLPHGDLHEAAVVSKTPAVAQGTRRAKSNREMRFSEPTALKDASVRASRIELPPKWIQLAHDGGVLAVMFSEESVFHTFFVRSCEKLSRCRHV